MLFAFGRCSVPRGKGSRRQVNREASRVNVIVDGMFVTLVKCLRTVPTVHRVFMGRVKRGVRGILSANTPSGNVELRSIWCDS